MLSWKYGLKQTILASQIVRRSNLIRLLVCKKCNILSPVAIRVFKHNFQINRCNVLMIIHSNKYSFVHRNVDVTVVTSIGECIPIQSVQMWGSNISFGTVGGNPFSVLGQGEMDGGDDAWKKSFHCFSRRTIGVGWVQLNTTNNKLFFVRSAVLH